jgi:hypothetical protein
MATRRPLVTAGGATQELPPGDTMPQALVEGLPASLDGKHPIAGPAGNPFLIGNDSHVTEDFEIPADGRNYMSAGPIEIDDGVVLDIADGAFWTVV